MSQKDYYATLDLTAEDRNLPPEEFTKVLKKKFRSASMKWHPDRNGGDKNAEEKFKEVAEAYGVLNDPKKRQQYDTFGTVDGNSSFGSMNTDDIFEHFAHDDFFASMFGRRPDFNQRWRYDYRGSDKNIRVILSVAELYNGGEKSITFRRYEKCSHCGGSGSKSGGEVTCPYCGGVGQITETKRNGFAVFRSTTTCSHCGGSGTVMADPCPHCGGNGIVANEATMKVPIPPFDKISDHIYYRGSGNACERNKGKNGDLNIEYSIDDRGDFSPQWHSDYNLFTKIDVPVLDCITGADMWIEHVDGSQLSMTVPPCSEENTEIIIKGKGLPLSSGERGNLMVYIHPKFPKSISKNDIKKVNELRKLKSFN